MEILPGPPVMPWMAMAFVLGVLTSSRAEGAVVPMPTLRLGRTRRASLLPALRTSGWLLVVPRKFPAAIELPLTVQGAGVVGCCARAAELKAAAAMKTVKPS